MSDDPTPAEPTFVYDFSFAEGMGPWMTWMPPSLITDEAGTVSSFVRLQAPGQIDPNHIDDIGALWLVSHLSISAVGAPGILDLRDAEIDITIRSADFDTHGGKLVFWICSTLPGTDVIRNYPVGLQITNWAYTGGDFAGDVTDEWQTITVRISTDPADWTYAGDHVSNQGEWGYRYAPLDLQTTLSAVDSTLHLAVVTDGPNQQPSGFLDIAGITIRTQTAASPFALPTPDYTGFGREDEAVTGTLAAPGAVGTPTFHIVAGSPQNGSVVLDAVTGAFVFTPTANHYGPANARGPVTFRYTVTDDNGTSASRIASLQIAPLNDAPTTATSDEDHVINYDQPFSSSLFHGDDVDGDRLTFAVVAGSVEHGTLVLGGANGRYTFTPDAGFSGQASFQYTVSDGQLTSAPKSVVLEVLPQGQSAPVPTLTEVFAALDAGDFDSFARGAIELADAGDPNAAYHYAQFLLSGRFVARNNQLAAEYLQLAVGTVPDASLQLAALYTAGDGVVRDYSIARGLLGDVSALPEAEYRLGLLDHLGFGAAQDDLAAAEHFLAGAKLGHLDAMYTVGRRYLDGEGVQASDPDAYFWLGLAIRLNARPDVPVFQDVLRNNQAEAGASLTPEQRALLDDAVATWQVGDPTPVNDPPVAASAAEHFAGDAGTTIGGTLLPGTDVDADRLRFLLEPGSSPHGSVVIDPATGAFAFTPAAVFFGLAQFAYRVSDGAASSATKIVTIQVAPVTAAFSDAAAIDENGTVTAAAGSGVLANDLAGDGSALVVNAVGGLGALVGVPVAGLFGTLSLNADGSYSYVADRAPLLTEGQLGLDVFAYNILALDGSISSSTLTFTVSGKAGVTIAGNGTVVGSSYADALSGGPGADYLVGLEGDDVLDGGFGASDSLQGGTGNDRYLVRDVGDSVTEFAGEGIDTIETALAAYTLVANVENLTFSGTGAFAGTGNELDNAITGGAGADRLEGGMGTDYLIGLDGDDVLDGGLGAPDTLQGGRGNDRYVVRDDDSVTEFADEGIDAIETALSAYTLAANLEHLTFTGAGAFTGTGNDLDNAMTGGGGDDRLDGRGGNNVLTGGAGTDTAVYAAATSAVSVNLGGGRATANGFGGSDELNGIENLVGSDFRDVMIGSAAANRLEGGAGADYLIGMDGDDVLIGGTGLANQLQGGLDNDTYYVSVVGDSVIEFAGEGMDTVVTSLTGYTLAANVEKLVVVGAGAFTVTGNALDNTITGGASSDRLIGGDGADVFEFRTALGSLNVDSLPDFLGGRDRIALDPAVFANLPGGSLAAAFVLGTSAQDADDRIIYDQATGSLWYDADGNGAGQAIQFASLSAGTALASSDFLVI